MTETDAEPPTHRLPGFSDIEAKCWEHFLESSTLVLDTLDKSLKEAHGLALVDFLVLDVLSNSPDGSTRIGHLAQTLVLRPSRVTEQIRRLESQGLVRRTTSTADGRGVTTSITREGRARVKPAARTYTREIRRHYLDQMTRQQMISLGESCRRISDALKDSEWPPKPNRR